MNEITRRQLLANTGAAVLLTQMPSLIKTLMQTKGVEHLVATSDSLAQFNPKRPGVVVFGGEWCIPCKVLEPYLETMAKKHPDMSFYSIQMPREGREVWDAADGLFVLRPHYNGLLTPMIIIEGKQRTYLGGFNPHTHKSDIYTNGLITGSVELDDLLKTFKE